MTTQVIDTPNNEAVTIDNTALDARSIMLASASSIAATVVTTEGTLADTAKAWGNALFRAVYIDKLNMDSMIGDSKVAAGWSVLNTTEAGKKAKSRLEVYFSNARLVAEKWDGLEQGQRDDVLAGLSSIHYMAGQMRKAKADADKAAKKEAERAKAEQAAADAKADAAASGSEPLSEEVVTFDVTEALELATLAFDEMSIEQMEAISSTFHAMVAAYDARINALTDAAIPLAA